MCIRDRNIRRVTTPIGVIGIIYESRPNVTADVAALCLKSSNCAILRGGSEAFYSNKILSNLFRKSLKKNKINQNCLQFIESKNRKIVDFLLSKMSKYVDVIVPRGGKSLVAKVQKYSNIHVIGHLEGLCHIYLDKESNLNNAIKVILNAKMRRTSICGAVETLLIEEKKSIQPTRCKFRAFRNMRGHFSRDKKRPSGNGPTRDDKAVQRWKRDVNAVDELLDVLWLCPRILHPVTFLLQH